MLSGSISTSASPIITGTGTPGRNVELYDGVRYLGFVRADANGNWSFSPLTPLKPGVHSFSAVSLEADGAYGEMSAPFNTVVPGGTGIIPATEAPAIVAAIDNVGPVQGVVPPNGHTDDTRLMIQGSGHPGDVIHLYDGNVLLGSSVVGSNSLWSFRPDTPLASGPHQFAATATGHGQSTSVKSNVLGVSVDAPPAPQVPSIDSVRDDFGATTGTIAPGGRTDDTKPTLSGHGRPGDLVTVHDNGVEIGSTTINASGGWTFTPARALASGTHDFSAIASSNGQAPSPASNHYAVTVIDPLAHPAITGAIDTDNGAAHSHMGHTTDAPVMIHGTGVPGDVLAVYDNFPGQPDAAHAGAGAVGSITVKPDGTWSFYDDGLLLGKNQFFVQSVTSGAASAEFVLYLDLPVAQTPRITNVLDDFGPKTGNVAPGGTTDDVTPTLQGSGHAGDTVYVSDGATLLGSATIGANGSWAFTPARALANGPHDFTATASGNGYAASAASSHYAITIAPDPVPVSHTPVITSVFDNLEHTNVAPSEGTADTLPTLIGTGVYGDTITIYEGDRPIGSTVVSQAGVWSLVPTAPLFEGKHDFTAIASGTGQSASAASNQYTIVVMAPEPVTRAETPVITGVHDDVGPVQGNVMPGKSTDDAMPTIKGTGHAGDKINLYDSGHYIGSAKVDSSGNWSFTPRLPLTYDVHNFSAIAVDRDTRDLSAESNHYAITVIEPLAALRPDIDSIIDHVGLIQGNLANGGITDDTRPRFFGYGHPGDVITVSDNSAVIGSTIVNTNGSWTFTPPLPLANGNHIFDAVASGNGQAESPTSNHFLITVDATSPPVPTIDGVLDNVGHVQGNIASGGTTDDTKPVFHGSGRPGDIVSVEDNHGAAIGSAKVASSGHWTITPTSPLADGAHDFFAYAISPAGVKGDTSSAFAVTVAPDPLPVADMPLIIGVIDNVGTTQGNIHAGGTTDDTTPTLNGYGNAGDVITVSDHGVAIGSTVVKGNGVWIFTPASALEAGAHDFSAVASGNGHSASAVSNHYTIDIAIEMARIAGGVKATGLSLADLLDSSEPDLFAHEAKGLVVGGKSAEQIDLGNTALAVGTEGHAQHVGGATHATYEHLGAQMEWVAQQNVGVSLH